MKITLRIGAIDQEKIALNTSIDFLRLRVWMGFRNEVGVGTKPFKTSGISRAFSWSFLTKKHVSTLAC